MTCINFDLIQMHKYSHKTFVLRIHFYVTKHQGQQLSTYAIENTILLQIG